MSTLFDCFSHICSKNVFPPPAPDRNHDLPMLSLRNLSFGFSAAPLVEHLSWVLADGAHEALLGASGCGKSTLLRLLLAAAVGPGMQLQELPWRSGEILPTARDQVIGYVPQEASLAPWLNVKSNVMHGLRLAARPESAVTYEELRGSLKLDIYEHLLPKQISVGTAKRAALARALILSPGLLLLDEPFAGFDFDLREHAIALILSLAERCNTTILLVTHEPYEAARLCQRARILAGRPAGLAATLCSDGLTEERFRVCLLTELREQLISESPA